MKLKSVEIENYRAIEHLRLPLDPSLTVLHGDNTCGKTSVLSAIAVGLGVIPDLFANEFEFRKSGVDFLETDLRVGESSLQVDLTATEGLAWKRERFVGMEPEGSAKGNRGLEALNKWMTELVHPEHEANQFSALPIVAFYDTDRAVSDIPDGWRDRTKDVRRYGVQAAKHEALSHVSGERMFSRYKALEGALTAHAKFHQLFQWFRDKEDEELREQRKRRNFAYRQNDLSAVRNAISAMLDGVSEPRIDVQPVRFSVSVKLENRHVDTLEIDQLSDGQRAVLALAADLAWRMAQGNPHLQDPLSSEAIVLIDEVELHLHPSWQQRILDDLRRTFPNAQFIVSTHSPQVLTTIEPEHIVELAREDGHIVAGSVAGWTYGAEAGDVLSAVMGVKERPDNHFTRTLARYRRLVSDDQGESEEALALRRELDGLSADDPALDRADLEIRRRKLFRQMGKST